MAKSKADEREIKKLVKASESKAVPKLKLSKADEEKLIKYVVEGVNKVEDRQIQARRDRKLWWNQFMAIPKHPVKLRPWRYASNVCLPLTQMTVQAIVPRIMQSTLGVWPFIRLRAQSADDERKIARAEPYLNWWLRNKMMLGVTSRGIVQGAAIGGIDYGKVRWRTEVREVNYMRQMLRAETGFDPLTGTEVQTGVKFTEKETREHELIYNGPWLDHLRADDVFKPGYSTDIEGDAWIAHRLWPTASHLYRMQTLGEYENVEAFLAHHQNRPQADEAYREMMRQTGKTPEQIQDQEQRGVYEVIEWHGEYEFTKGKPIDIAVTVGLKSKGVGVKLRAIHRPYFHGRKPIHACKIISLPGRHEGMGIPQMTEQMQNIMDTLYNQMIDNGTAANTLMFKIRRGAGINPQDANFAPMGRLEVDDMEDIKEFSMGNVRTGFWLNALQFTLMLFREHTGVTQQVLGSKSERTATGTIRTLQESNVKFQDMTNEVGNFYISVTQDSHDLLKQFVPASFRGPSMESLQEAIQKGIPPEMTVPMTRADIQGKFEYYIETSPLASNKSLEFETINSLVTMFMGRPDLVDTNWLVTKLMRTLGISDWKPGNPALSPLLMAMQQQQGGGGAGQAQPGGNGGDAATADIREQIDEIMAAHGVQRGGMGGGMMGGEGEAG